MSNYIPNESIGVISYPCPHLGGIYTICIEKSVHNAYHKVTVFGPVPPPPMPWWKYFSTSLKKTLKPFSRNPTWLTYVHGKIFLVDMLKTLSQGHAATKAVKILPCPQGEVRTTHPITSKLRSHIPHFHALTSVCLKFILWINIFDTMYDILSKLSGTEPHWWYVNIGSANGLGHQTISPYLMPPLHLFMLLLRSWILARSYDNGNRAW